MKMIVNALEQIARSQESILRLLDEQNDYLHATEKTAGAATPTD